ncbi:MAG: hypothetical protein ACI4EU_08160 [Butyrivibrio sp.]
MILRDIYDEICEIFHFKYEKNRNGTVRVNTIIRKLVYPELYKNKKWDTTQLEYFLENVEDSYQNFPNIRNSFSELMRPKDNSNRFPVMEFCDRINIEKMYSYYDNLDYDEGQLEAFIEKVFSAVPSFHTKLRAVCQKPTAFLVWIIIFAMFNTNTANDKFDKYLKSYHTEDAAVTIFESDQNHQFSMFLFHKKRRISLIKVIIYVLYGLLIVFSLSHYTKFIVFISDKAYCAGISILGFGIFIIQVFWLRLCKKYSDYKTYFSYLPTFPSMKQQEDVLKNSKFILVAFKHTATLNVNREQRRKIDIPVTLLLCFVSVIPSIVLNSLPLLVVFISSVLGLELLFQRVMNDRRTRIYYDRMTGPEDLKPDPIRGLAKYHIWEYEKTGIQPEHEYYKHNVHMHSTACYRHIFRIAWERIEYRLLYIHLLSLSALILLPIMAIYYFKVGNITEFFHFPSTLGFHQTMSLYIIIWSILNYLITATTEDSCRNMSELACLSMYADGNPPATEHMFLELIASGTIKEVDCSRGIYTYCMSMISQGKKLEEIYPETDRISFLHRFAVFNQRTLTCILIVCLITFSFFVWHLGFTFALIPIIVTSVLSYLIFAKFINPKIHLRRVRKEIMKLQKDAGSDD